jgi:hypothetical protein
MMVGKMNAVWLFTPSITRLEPDFTRDIWSGTTSVRVGSSQQLVVAHSHAATLRH